MKAHNIEEDRRKGRTHTLDEKGGEMKRRMGKLDVIRIEDKEVRLDSTC